MKLFRHTAALIAAALLASTAYADVKISDLPAGTTLGGTEPIPAVQAGATVKVTPAQVNTYVQAQTTSAGIVSKFTGTCTGTNYLAANGTCVAPAGGASGANPTASVGVNAVNGVATTFMRSDGAPPIDSTISPTMTGTWTFQNNLLTFGNVTGPAVLVGSNAQTNTSSGNTVALRGGPGGSTSGAAGALTFNGGVPVDGNGGSITLTASNAVGTNRAGGSIIGNAGAQTGSGAVGNVLFGAGTSVGAVKGGTSSMAGGFASGTGVGGDASISGGVGNATGAGGQGIVRGGAGNGTLGNAGDAVVIGGLPVDGNGGSVQITGNNGVGTNRNGGSVVLVTGTPTGSGTAGTFTVNGKLMASTGTFNMTASAGLASPPSVSAKYTVNGGQALVCTNTVSGTSNATNFILSGIPAAAIPSVSVATTLSYGTDNGINGVISAIATNTGTLVLAFNGTSWTATGSKASGNSCYAYPL